MNRKNRITAATSAAVLSFGIIAGLAPLASAAEGVAPAGCSQSERIAHREQIAAAKVQIDALRGSKPESGEKGEERRQAAAERRAQIATFKAQIEAAKSALASCRAAAQG